MLSTVGQLIKEKRFVDDKDDVENVDLDGKITTAEQSRSTILDKIVPMTCAPKTPTQERKDPVTTPLYSPAPIMPVLPSPVIVNTEVEVSLLPAHFLGTEITLDDVLADLDTNDYDV